MPEYFAASDFFVGQNVKLNEFDFTLIDADEYAFRYFEKRAEQFPVANVELIKKKVLKYVSDKCADIRAYFARQDPDDTGYVQYEQLYALLTQICDALAQSLSMHEIMTLARFYGEFAKSSAEDALATIASAQHQLRKKNYDDLDGLRIAFLQRDKTKSDYLDYTNLMQIVHSIHLPVDDDHVRALLSLVDQKVENGVTLYNHKQLHKHLNWRDNAVFLNARQIKQLEVKSVDTESLDAAGKPKYVERINYRAILKDWFGDKALDA